METTVKPLGTRAQEVYDELLQRVQAMPPGVPLPAVPELMRDLSASQSTIDSAYRLLERQGYVERRPRKGVFAADRLATGEVAVVVNELCLAPGASQSYGQTVIHLRRLLAGVHPTWPLKLHLGSGEVPGPSLPSTLDLLEPAILPRLRGVFSFHPLLALQDDLSAAGVPVVHLGVGSLVCGAGVYLDQTRLLRDGLQHLAERGCRSVTLLHVRYTGPNLPGRRDPIPDTADFAAGLGLDFRHEFARCDHRSWTEQHGHELFMHLHVAGELPDGLLVADDILCHGVLRATLELGLDLPRDLRVITQANRGLPLPYHQSVTRLEYDLEERATKAVELLEALVRGDKLERTVEWEQAALVEGETT